MPGIGLLEMQTGGGVGFIQPRFSSDPVDEATHLRELLRATMATATALVGGLSCDWRCRVGGLGLVGG